MSFRSLMPIRQVTCFYDTRTGALAGLRIARPDDTGSVHTALLGRTESRWSNTISLGDSADVYISALDATMSGRLLLRVRWHLSDGSIQECDVLAARVRLPSRVPQRRAKRAAAALAVARANVTAMFAGQPTLQHAYYYGPVLLGRPAGLASLRVRVDAQTRCSPRAP
jgi:hypothetical protein